MVYWSFNFKIIKTKWDRRENMKEMKKYIFSIMKSGLQKAKWTECTYGCGEYISKYINVR